MPAGHKVIHWTQEEDEILKQFYHIEGPSVIQPRLPSRSLHGIKMRAYKLDCHFLKVWTEEEECILREFYPTRGQTYVASRLNRDRENVKHKAQQLGLKGRPNHRQQIKTSSNSYEGYQDISMTRWNSMRTSAIKRNLKFELTMQYAWDLYKRQEGKCALSGVPIQFPSNRATRDGTASLDRIDSSEGYIEGNVQWLHKDVNRMKWDLSQSDFISFCHLIVGLHPKS